MRKDGEIPFFFYAIRSILAYFEEKIGRKGKKTEKNRLEAEKIEKKP